MLDPRVRKALERSAGRDFRLSVSLFPVVALALFLIAALDVYVAGIWGNLNGYSLASVFEEWARPVEVHRHYSGFLIKAVSRIDMAVVSLLLGCLVLFTTLLLRRQRWQAENIIAELQRHGAWQVNGSSLTSAARDDSAGG